jgi:glucose/arabinose dehydrogenase
MKTLIASAFVAASLTPALSADPKLERIGSDFERPLYVTSLPDNANLLFVVEQGGKIFQYDQKEGKTYEEPFLDISDEVRRRNNEEGLLGLAFAPDYAESGRFYVNFSNENQTNEIVRYTVPNPKTARTCPRDSKEVLLTFKQPYGNHNGGYLEFGPDGNLYIGTGDGGSANDPKDNGQSLESLLGKILRIDVSDAEGYSIPSDNPFVNKEGLPEIFAYGLRNPWRCSWDGNDFYIADVGQNRWEEVNVVALDKLRGANFGWRPREGFHRTPGNGVGGPMKEEYIDPVLEYDHGGDDDEGLSINGSYVYRGSVESLQGQYLYSDHVNPRVWSFEYQGGQATRERDLTETLARPDGQPFRQLASFGQDAAKEVYLVELSGAVWKIVE